MSTIQKTKEKREVKKSRAFFRLSRQQQLKKLIESQKRDMQHGDRYFHYAFSV